MKKGLSLTTLVVGLTFGLSGCASVSGLIDAGDDFGCPMQEGVTCRSLSEVHASLHEPVRRPDVIVERVDASEYAVPDVEPSTRADRVGRSALHEKRRAEEVLVMTILPWVDADGDLHDTQTLWLRTQEAGWYVERLRRDALTPLPNAR